LPFQNLQRNTLFKGGNLFQETTEEMEPNSQEDENDGEKPRKGSAELASSGLFHDTLISR
jgi:hypothetical protein